ncbi:chromatin assembly factor 1 subunit A-domain-containing protein [Tricladium varicosporioides]|nr:chromatin assembly factor 1 subunit A-domain-containing protein [Hymenoscyphus varicosporioides]
MSVHESPRPLKRTHDSFEGLADLPQPQQIPQDLLQKIQAQEKQQQQMDSIQPSTLSELINARDHSPARSSSEPLSDVGSTTPSYDGSPMVDAVTVSDSAMTNSPSALAALGTAPPPAKKAKLTFQEKEMKRIQKEIKDQERAEERAKKEAERKSNAEEKARRDAEREAERKKKEAEKEAKRAAQEAEKAAKEEKRKQKQEQKQRQEEEKLKREEEELRKKRSQKTISTFFGKPASKTRESSVESRGRASMSPAPGLAPPSAATSTPVKAQRSPYEQMFPPFFVHKEVTLGAINRFERDAEGSESIQNALDSYMLGNQSPGRQRPFNASSLFRLRRPEVLRGVNSLPVREIMAEFRGDASRPIDLTTDSQNSQIKKMQHLLQKVPMKILHFREDVRPPYRGTYTSRPVNGISKLARNPMRRDLPNCNYDYDSEAEWVEDEDAEDLNSEGEEEEDVEDGDEMDGFLDDENDESINSRRMVIQGDLEPISTGLCWEDRKRCNANVKLIAYQMEIIIDPKMKSIDPFSTSYWQPVPSANTMNPPRIPLTTMKTPNGISQPSANKLVKPFFQNTLPFPSAAPSCGPSPAPSTTVSKDSKPKKMISAADLPAFKEAIQGNNLSKIGLIEVLKKQFPGRPGIAIKNTLEAIATRIGSKEADKRWVVNDDA